MVEKTKRFFRVLLRKLRKSILHHRLCVVVFAFKDFFKALEKDVQDFFCDVILFTGSLVVASLLCLISSVISLVGGF